MSKIAKIGWTTEEEILIEEEKGDQEANLQEQIKIGFPVLKEVVKKLVKGEELSLEQLEQLKGLYDVW